MGKLNQLNEGISILKQVHAVNVLISPWSVIPLLESLNGSNGYRKIILGLAGANSAWLFGHGDCRKQLEEIAAKNGFDVFDAKQDSVHKVNNWVMYSTRGKIKHVINQLPLNVAFILVNALFFSSPWAAPFSETYSGEFNCPDGRMKDVIMMKRTGRFFYANHDGIQVIQLPFDGGRLSMWVFLPEDLSDFVGRSSTDNLVHFMRQADERKVEVHMPRFRLSYDNDLANFMVDGKFGKLFRPGGFPCDPELYVDSVFHKTVFEVSEKGAEGAAATAVVGRYACGAVFVRERPVPVIKIDRPFLFMVSDDSLENVVFLGRAGYPASTYMGDF